jgi:hypothetical protein
MYEDLKLRREEEEREDRDATRNIYRLAGHVRGIPELPSLRNGRAVVGHARGLGDGQVT